MVITEEIASKLRTIISNLSVEKEPVPTHVDPDLKKLEGIKGVFVDVYGTIMISGTEPMLRKDGTREVTLLSKTFESFNIDYKPGAVEEGISLLHKYVQEAQDEKKAEGVDYPEVEIIPIWTKLMTDLNEKDLIDSFDPEIAPEFITDFVIRYDDPWLMPGLDELMTGLKEKKLHTGIISNSSFYTPPTLEALSGKQLDELGFPDDNCFWSFEVKVAKPSLKLYEVAAEQIKNELNLDPSEVIFVGNDMLNDMYPAQEVGFKTAFFAGDERSLRLREDEPRCENVKPDITITKLEQILECV